MDFSAKALFSSGSSFSRSGLLAHAAGLGKRGCLVVGVRMSRGGKRISVSCIPESWDAALTILAIMEVPKAGSSDAISNVLPS